MFITTPGPSEPPTAGQHPPARIPDDNGWSSHSQAPRHILPASDHHHTPDFIRNESSSENNSTQGKGHKSNHIRRPANGFLPASDHHHTSDFIHDESSSENNSTQGKRHKSNHIPRPANKFMLFRSDFVKTRSPDFKTEGKNLSKLASEAWANLRDDEKRKWTDAAKEAKEKHARENPDYKYRPKSAKSRRQGARRVTPYPSPGDRASTQSSPDASKRIRVGGPSNYRTSASVPQPAPNRLPTFPQPLPRTNTAVAATPLLPEDIWSQRSSVPVAQMRFEQAQRTHQSDYLYAYGREGYTNLRSGPSLLPSSTSRVPSSSRVQIPPVDGQSLYDGQLRVTGRTSMQTPAINWDMIRTPLRDESISPYSALDSQSTLTPLDIPLDMFPYPSSSAKFENIEPPTRALDEATAALEGGATTGVELPSLYSFADESLYASGTESSTHINKLFSDFSSHIEQHSTNVENYERDDHIIERYHDSTSGNILSLFTPTTTKGPEGQV